MIKAGKQVTDKGTLCMKMAQIASEGGLLPTHIDRQEVEIWPAKRREVVVDFTTYIDGRTPTKTGDVMYLTNTLQMLDGRKETGNQDPGFDNRSAITNGLRNAVFVSLHVSSSGPVGTARTYYYVFPSDAAPAVTPTASATAAPSATPSGQTASAQPGSRSGLVEWDRAQRSSVELSRQLAGLVQAELVRRFKGSPEIPVAAPVRQLRTIAAPAIAIELSSINVTDAKRLDQMAQPLAEAIGKAVAEFRFPGNAPAGATSGGH